jgi:hypothetical protein
MKFNVGRLANLLNEKCPQILFAFLHGSSKDAQVKQGSDIDLALFIEGRPTLEPACGGSLSALRW